MTHYPGTKYCGPGTSDFTQLPTNEFDEACRRHDLSTPYTKPGWNKYLFYNAADSKFQHEIKDLPGLGPLIANTAFTGKRKLTEFLRGSVPEYRDLYAKEPRQKFSVKKGFKDYYYKEYQPNVRTEFMSTQESRNAARRTRKRSFWKKRMAYGRFRAGFRRRFRRRAYRRSRYPYRSRYRYRRRFYGRRRFNKTRRYGLRSYIRNLIHKEASKPRTYHVQDNEGIVVPVGSYSYWNVAELGTPGELVAALADTGDGSAALGPGNDFGKINVTYSVLDMVLSNGAAHDVYCQIYICKARRDVRYDAETTLHGAVLQALKEGWDIRQLDTDEDTNISNRHLTTEYSFLTPYQSSIFCTNWKIVKVMSGVLKPGVQNHFTVRSKRLRNYSNVELGTTHTSVLAIGGYTKTILVRLSPALGHDTTLTTEVCNLSAPVGARWKKRYNISFFSNNKPLMGINDLATNDFTNGGELVSEYAEQLDEE